MKCDCCGAGVVEWRASNTVKCLNCGHVKQKDIQPFIYNSEYVNAYRNLPEIEMSYIRLSTVWKYAQSGKLIDVGCGSGEFVRQAKLRGYDSYGYDVHNDDIGAPMTKDVTDKCDIITMFDSLEHIDNVNEFLSKLNTRLIVATCPFLKMAMNEYELINWRHYKPNEHLHYFTYKSIKSLFAKHGYVLVNNVSVEDLIRRTENGPNTMTYVFVKKEAL